MINELRDRVLSKGEISREEALLLTEIPSQGLSRLTELLAAANMIRDSFRRDCVALCCIINAKSGACSEDCSYCAQSSRNSTNIAVYPLVEKAVVMAKACEAKEKGIKRFSIVTSGRKVGEKELKEIGAMVREIREMGLLPCATLGLLNREELAYLKNQGLERYHHNLETSERYFPEICRTHTYQDKIKTIEAALMVGLSVCSGGIFGMGESWEDRIAMARAVKELGADSTPINFLMPIKGTAIGERKYISAFEALTIISLYRFLLPNKELRVCAGRIQVLGDLHSLVFMAGADAILTGNYLTTTGRTYDDDLRLIKTCGLTIEQK